MPIYEYFCQQCNVVFSFMSKTVSPAKSPPCPRCRSLDMEKQLSKFTSPKAASGEQGEFDEGRVQSAFENLLNSAENIEANDVAGVNTLVETFATECGYEYSERLKELLESGEKLPESPDDGTINNLLQLSSAKAKEGGPHIDPGLYSM